MVENWVVVIIPVKDRRRLLLDAIKPIVEALDSENLIETFHFFFEPELHFRVLPKNEIPYINSIDRIHEIIDKNLSNVRDSIGEPKYSDYHGESSDFGDEGWLYARKFFEYGCRICLLVSETLSGRKPLTSCRLDRQFNLGKFVHCFLNQQGLTVDQEAAFHNDRNFERLMQKYGIFKRLETIEERVKKQEKAE